MGKLLEYIGFNRALDYKEKILYIMVGICILIAVFYEILYLIYIPFLPALIVHVIYILFNFSLYLALKKERYSFVKFSIILAHIIQLTLAVFLWFPQRTGYNLYYLIVPMVAFLILDYDNLKERYFAVTVSIIITVLFVISELTINRGFMYETGDCMNLFLSSLTIVTSIMPMTFILTKFSKDLYTSQKELKLLANTDALTRIMNRRVLYEHGVEEFQLARKYQHDFSLILLDIDHFKNVNDQYGHPVGDELLKKLTELISENIRKEDLFSRYGGEEFALLLRKTDSESGTVIANKLLEIIRNKSFNIDSHEIHITVSIGIVQYAMSHKDFDHMMKAVDKALYYAKNNGRNQVASA